MKTIFVTAGGSATAWGICNAIRRVAGERVRLIVSDTNPKHLVHSASLADHFEQVSPIETDGYREHMLKLLSQTKTDVFVPLIDFDLKEFPSDDPDLINMGVKSSAPKKDIFQKLSDKKRLVDFLNSLGIATPRLFTLEELEPDKEYFIKPRIGFGSRNTGIKKGRDLIDQDFGDIIVQEFCPGREITSDVCCYGNSALSICRERIEVKAGVCTKARVFKEPQIELKIKRIAECLELPVVSCVQFMQSSNGNWLLTDYNLRYGGGSALSEAVGFKISDYAVSIWLGLEPPALTIPKTDRYVVRYYNELVTK